MMREVRAQQKEPDRRHGRKMPDDPAYEVLVALRRIIRAIDIQSKRMSKICGLTTPQVVIMQAIRDLGEVTTKQISDHVTLSQATVTTIMDRLEQHDLVERYRSVKDRRVVHTRLTMTGRQVLKKTPPLLHESFIDSFSCMGVSDQEKIVETLRQVAEMLGGGNLDAAPILDIQPPDAVV